MRSWFAVLWVFLLVERGWLSTLDDEFRYTDEMIFAFVHRRWIAQIETQDLWLREVQRHDSISRATRPLCVPGKNKSQVSSKRKLLLKFVRLKRSSISYALQLSSFGLSSAKRNDHISDAQANVSHVSASQFAVSLAAAQCMRLQQSHSIYLTHNKCDIYNIQRRCIFISLSLALPGVFLFHFPLWSIVAIVCVRGCRCHRRIQLCCIVQYANGRALRFSFSSDSDSLFISFWFLGNPKRTQNYCSFRSLFGKKGSHTGHMPYPCWFTFTKWNAINLFPVQITVETFLILLLHFRFRFFFICFSVRCSELRLCIVCVVYLFLIQTRTMRLGSAHRRQ